jgi:hypothetical protein
MVEQVVSWCVQGSRACMYGKFTPATHTLYDHNLFGYHRLDFTSLLLKFCELDGTPITQCRTLHGNGLYCHIHEYKQYNSVNACCLQ